MGRELVFRGDKTLDEIVKELKKILETHLEEPMAVGICELDGYFIEITLMKRDELDEH